MFRYLCAVAYAILMAMASPTQAHAQSVPFPDQSAHMGECSAHLFVPGQYCQVQSLQYIDKPPDSTACPAYTCAGGPGRYQELRIINPPGQQVGYFIWSFAFVPDDVIIQINGPSHTKALPAGPALPQTISTTQGRYPYPRASVGYQLNNGSFQWFATDQAGNFSFNFVPPSRQTGTFHITAACWSGCVNRAEKDIEVASCDICQTKGNPIAPGSGEKLQTEPDWQDASPHPLSMSRYYRSHGAAAAGLGPNWSHDYSATITGTSLSRIVQLGSGMRITFNRSDIDKPWLSDTGSDALAEEVGGPVFTRASDETRYQFDGAGVLQTITQRNGWVMSLSYTAGRLTRVTNAFGRSLLLMHDASGRVVSITPPGAASVSYGYDTAGRLASASYPDGTSRAYVYENPSWPNALTGIVSEAGYRYASFGYDERGRANYTQHDGGIEAYAATYLVNRAAALSVDPVDPSIYRDKVRVTTPLGLAQTYEYQGGDGTLRLVSSSNKEANDDIYSRLTGARNLPVSQTDHVGNVTNFEWDTSRKLLTSSTSAANQAEAQTTSTQWHPNLRLPVLVTEAGRLTAYTYDPMGNKLSVAVTDTALNQTRTTRWTYAANGLMDSMSDASGGLWHYAYDAAGNRTSVKNPLGHQTSYAYDAAGRLTSQTDPNGLVTTWTWDTRGRLLTQTADGETTTYSYTSTGQLETAKLPGGYALTYGYDKAQRLTRVADNRGNTTSYMLDAAGNRTREEVRDAGHAIASVTSRIVNNLNQVTQVQGAQGQTTQLGYDANGEPVSQTDPLAQTTRQTLDGLRRPTQTSFADSNVASQAWSALDQLTAAVDPKGVKTSYTTNAFGDTTRETSPDIGTVSYEHDAMGRVIRQTDAKGNITTWTRDALGRPLSVNYAAGHEVRYSWDGAGQSGYLSGIEDKSGTTTYSRDKLGRITKKVQSVNDNPNNPSSFTTSYSYAGGKLASITYPSGLKLIYNRDATGQITSVDTQASGRGKPVNAFVSHLAWTALNQPKAWNWSNGDTAARSFDADGRMSSNEFASYSYDAASRITAITQNLWATSTATGTVTPYTTPLAFTAGYDNRNRLSAFNRIGSQTSYTYDPNSNRLTAIDRVTSDIDLDGQFDAADDFVLSTSQALNVDETSNKLLGFRQTVVKTNAGQTASTVVTPINYTLDDNGALTSDGLRSFDYDASNRMSKVRLSKDGEAATVSYLHNAMGQRVFKSEVQIAQTLPNEATLGTSFIDWLKARFQWMFIRDQASTSIGTAYTYADGALPQWALLGEYDNGSASGAGRTEYIWLPTPDGAIPIGMYRNGKLFAIHADHLGTPRLMTNDAKAVVWQWPYSGFGNNKPTRVLKATANPKQAVTNQPELLKATAAVEMNLRFPGQYYDAETRTHYNYHRNMNPLIGRYTQNDPLGLAAGWNRYGYAYQNALMFTDATGLLTTAEVNAALSTLTGNYPANFPKLPTSVSTASIGNNVLGQTDWRNNIQLNSDRFGNTSECAKSGDELQLLQTLAHEMLHVNEAMLQRLLSNSFRMSNPLGYFHRQLDDKADAMITSKVIEQYIKTRNANKDCTCR